MEIFYNHIFLCSRHDVGGRRKKYLLNFVQLSFTKIYRHLNFMPITSSHHFVSSHHCALISPRLHRWNFPDSKQRPILSPLTYDASHYETFRSPTNIQTDSFGWGEPKAKRKHCTRTPFREGKATRCSRTLTLTLAPTPTETRATTSLLWCDITLTPLRFSFSAEGVCV